MAKKTTTALDPRPSGDFSPPKNIGETDKVNEQADANGKVERNVSRDPADNGLRGECRLCGEPVTAVQDYVTVPAGVAHLECIRAAIPATAPIGDAHATGPDPRPLPQRIRLKQPHVVHSDDGPQSWFAGQEIDDPDEIHFLTRHHRVEHEVLES